MSEEFNAYPLAQKIAAELGEAWYVTEGHWTKDAYLCDGQGAKLHLSARTWQKQDEGKLCIDGSVSEYHEVSRYNEPKHEIKVSYVKKGPAQIARDIERRLLPAYREALAVLKQRQQEHDDATAATEALVKDLAATLGPSATRHYMADDRVWIGQYGDVVYGDLRVKSDKVRFEIEVPRSHAILLAAELAAIAKRKKVQFND